MQDKVEETLDHIKQRGWKVTVARRAVVECLIEGVPHLSADDIAALVRRNYPDIHLSTVYRTLEALEEAGIIDHVHLGHGRAIYHLSDQNHQHLVCEFCGAVIEAPDELFDQLGSALISRWGFRMRSKHFAVIGTCRQCAHNQGYTSD